MYRLTYTATLQETDMHGVPTGETYQFAGIQMDPTSAPQAADLAALASAMGADISTQMQAGYPMQAATAAGE